MGDRRRKRQPADAGIHAHTLPPTSESETPTNSLIGGDGVDMATFTATNLRWAGVEGVTAASPVEFYDPGIKEGNTQSFVVGDLVTVTPGTGTVAEFAANGAHISGIALTNATNAAQGSSGHVAIRFQKILPGEVYIGTVYSGASAGATAITQLGARVGLRSPSAGVWVLDVAEVADTSANAQIVGFYYGTARDSSGNEQQMALGDTGGWAYFKFIQNRVDTQDGSVGGMLDFGS